VIEVADLDELSRCGLFDCGTCKYRKQGHCPGCVQGNSYLEQWGRTPCSICTCVQAQSLQNCTSCTNAVCTLRNDVDTICPLRGGSEDSSLWVWQIARYLESKGAPCHDHLPVPRKTLMRLRWYAAALVTFASNGVEIISSRDLADKVGVGSAMVRKDLSCFGELGKPGVGYNVTRLQESIQGLFDQHTCTVAWVGAQWLSNVSGMFSPSPGLNFRIVAAFDPRPEWVGRNIGEWVIRPLSELAALVSDGSIDGAVLALPENPSGVADYLINAGVKGILNLTSVTLTTPPHINVRHIDLIGEMMALAMRVKDSDEEFPIMANRHRSRIPVEMRHNA
jgi:redox-sensing transcriptional repressor